MFDYGGGLSSDKYFNGLQQARVGMCSRQREVIIFTYSEEEERDIWLDETATRTELPRRRIASFTLFLHSCKTCRVNGPVRLIYPAET